MNLITRQQVRNYIKNKSKVYILETDELWNARDFHYAIIVIGSKGFWLNAFKKYSMAVKYCTKLGLKIVNDGESNSI
jgi:hypothetical protein